MVFDLDGVVTDTANLHASAWKEAFDQFLEEDQRQTGTHHDPFDADLDYRRYVDGKPRHQGVLGFLESRNLSLPPGEPDEAPNLRTSHGLAALKNQIFRRLLESRSADVYIDSLVLVCRLQRAGIRVALATSSRNCDAVLDSAQIGPVFPIRVDGNDIRELELTGKPQPDMFVVAAQRLELDPPQVAVIEDSEAGIEAAVRGHFGLALGVDRSGEHQTQLAEAGADFVVRNLTSEVEVLNPSPAL